MNFHGPVGGSHGNMWLLHMREPDARIDLAGEWTPRGMDLKWSDKLITLPGRWRGHLMAKRTVTVDASLRDKTVMMRIDMGTPRGRPNGFLINGHWMMRLHHSVGHRVYLNVTPWIKFGEKNEIVIVGRGEGDKELTIVALECFPRGSFP